MSELEDERGKDAEQSCGDCWYWRPPSQGSTNTTMGCLDLPACHRVPLIGGNVGSSWLHTDKNHWCIDWRPRWRTSSGSGSGPENS